jgi:hypothetical protein
MVFPEENPLYPVRLMYFKDKHDIRQHNIPLSSLYQLVILFLIYYAGGRTGWEVVSASSVQCCCSSDPNNISLLA